MLEHGASGREEKGAVCMDIGMEGGGGGREGAGAAGRPGRGRASLLSPVGRGPTVVPRGPGAPLLSPAGPTVVPRGLALS